MIQIALGNGTWEINETAQGVETRLNKSAPKIVEAIQLIGFVATIFEVNNSPSIFFTDNIGKETALEEALKALCSLNNKRFTKVTLPEDACAITLSDILKEDQAKMGRFKQTTQKFHRIFRLPLFYKGYKHFWTS